MQKNSAFARWRHFAPWQSKIRPHFYTLMKISLYSFIILLASLQVILADISRAQDIREMRITFGVENTSLKHALQKLQKESGYNVFYLSPKVTPYKGITLATETRTVQLTLELLLRDTPFSFQQEGKTIILQDKPEASSAIPPEPLQALVLPVKGRVTDGKGDALPGVSVLVKGTQQGTITDAQGNFSLDVVTEQAILVFSYVGYIGKEIPVENQTTLQITLEEDEKALEEVVVVGYGVQRKSDLTGTVASVPRERLEMIPNVNIAQAIQGIVPGVMVQTSSAGAEPSQSIMIRGRNSIKADNAPLLIVDGVPYRGNIMDINPNDVKSIEILKDASAAAIYGSRGANGVILITTKQGVKGSMRVTYDMKLASQSHTNLPRVMTGSEFYAFKQERRPGFMTATEQAIYDAGEAVNWYDIATRKGRSQHHELSISGASDKIRYYLSGGLLDIRGISVSDDYQRISGRVNIETDLTKWMAIGTRTQLSSVNKSGVPPDFLWVYYSNPLVTPFDENGNVTIFPWPGNQDIYNPLERTVWDNTDKSYQVISNNYLTIDVPFVKGLNYRLNTGIRNTFSNSHIYRGRNSSTGYAQNGSSESNRTNSNNIVVENVLSYQRDFGKHNVFGTMVYGFEKNESSGNAVTARGYPHDFLDMYSVSQAQLIQPSYSFQKSHLISQMLRLNYAYNSRYLLTLTGRRDGFSGFGANTKWGIFPSVAVGWNLTQEAFFPAKDVFSELKLRASWGQNGNQGVGSYQTISRLGSRDVVDAGVQLAGYIPSVLGQEDLGWETSETLNLGLDFGILKDRVSGSLNLFRTLTNSLLLDRAISPVHGLSSITQNIGKTENKGLEIALQTSNIARDNFSWTSSGNISVLRNKIVDLYGDGLDDVVNGWFIGSPILVNYDFVREGIWRSDEVEAATRWDSKPGFVKIRDVNNDGKLTAAEDRQIIGQRDPKLLWGISNVLSYKNLNLNFFVHGVHGGTRTSGILTDEEVWAEIRRNTIVKDWWTPENPNSSWVKNEINAERMAGIRSVVYENAGFVRIKDVTLSYDVATALIEKIGLTRLRVYGTGRNLFTFSSWSGLDPELDSQLAAPLQKEFVLGLTIVF